MKIASFRFHGELNDLLPASRQAVSFLYPFKDHQSVKHLIEAAGVPHVEVFFIHANDIPVGFSYLVQDSDRIEVFPVSSAANLQDERPLQAPLMGEPRFVLDNHLGKLATYLRMLGLDARYSNHYQDEELAEISESSDRILLSRDTRLLMRNQVRRGYWVRSLDPEQQLSETVQRFKLQPWVVPFQRCLRCNTPLQPVRKEEIIDRLQPLTRKYFQEFRLCPNCKQVYWKGSHFERMDRFIRSFNQGLED